MKLESKDLVRRLAVLCAVQVGCVDAMAAPPPDPPADEWRYETVTKIMHRSSLPWHVDEHCLPDSSGGAALVDEVIVLRFRVGRAGYYQAFPQTPELEWRVGDRAAFVPRTCDIKRVEKR
jgi:hypothetical protein